MPITITSIAMRLKLKTLNRTTAKTTYSRPSSALVKIIRSERPRSRPKFLRSMARMVLSGRFLQPLLLAVH